MTCTVTCLPSSTLFEWHSVIHSLQGTVKAVLTLKLNRVLSHMLTDIRKCQMYPNTNRYQNIRALP